MSLDEMKIMVILSIFQAKDSSKLILVLMKKGQNWNLPVCSLYEFLQIRNETFSLKNLANFERTD